MQNIKNYISKIVDLEENFLAELNKHPQLKEKYEKFNDVERRLASTEVFDCFSEGFKFGLLLGLDVAGFIKDE